MRLIIVQIVMDDLEYLDAFLINYSLHDKLLQSCQVTRYIVKNWYIA